VGGLSIAIRTAHNKISSAAFITDNFTRTAKRRSRRTRKSMDIWHLYHTLRGENVRHQHRKNSCFTSICCLLLCVPSANTLILSIISSSERGHEHPECFVHAFGFSECQHHVELDCLCRNFQNVLIPCHDFTNSDSEMKRSKKNVSSSHIVTN